MTSQNTFFTKKIQEIQCKPSGKILQSSDTIFKLGSEDDLYDLHPFFESLQTELQSNEPFGSHLAFPCVQLDIHGKEAICDVTIKKERDFLAILLFDYSQHYEHLHEAALEKKSALLLEQEFDLKREHLEEKKAYLEFMKQRIDNKMILEIEQIIKNIHAIKLAQLTPEQQSILEEIEKSVGTFHLKAIQIRNELDFNFDS
ncbi:hypothetical protein G5B37_09380 [Rasiella rasia]|uniref:Uncharacterized protein n=1 Tax=Rasiella rasia TaxID=2744027 RepID=A0A6G6GMF5_9FLAO|nr:hypothetical protein [Rasiella rasia]QIE59765.1 hypothetical protein G5B37_09380 [Rasiella rasia]